MSIVFMSAIYLFAFCQQVLLEGFLLLFVFHLKPNCVEGKVGENYAERKRKTPT